MAQDPKDISQENQQCFTDFFLASVDPDPSFSGLNLFIPNDTTSRYLAAAQNTPQNTIHHQQHRPSEVKHIMEPNASVEEDNVFIQTPGFYNQGMNRQPFVPYQACHNELPQQGQQILQFSNNSQMTGQNYNGYMHSSSPNSGDRASISNSPYTPTVRQDFPLSPLSSVPQQLQKTGSIPSSSDYPGDHGFEIYFGASTESAVKSAQFTHSTVLRKLFVKMNVLCPIQFRCLKQPQKGSVIRALPLYTRPEHVTEVVSRCPNHQIQDSSVDYLARHLIRAEHPGNNSVHYNTSTDGRENVSVEYVPPETGSQYITVFYKYMCLSSCVGGINRRPTMTIFTLESPDGIILGRRCVEVRICTCPGRDRSQEERKEERKRKPALPAGYVLLPKKKKPLSMPSTSASLVSDGDNSEEFFLRIKGKEKYEILKKLKEALDLMEFVSSEQRELYHQQEREQNQQLGTPANEDNSSMAQILSNFFKQQPRDDCDNN